MNAATPLLAARESPVILLVDDNPDDREIYMRALKKIDEVSYRYAEASGGDSMLTYLAGSSPDCVLLDYSLPGRNGLELLSQIVKDHPFLPVVMMTGQGNENIAVQAIKAGAQHYLVKSDVTPDLLHETISAAIKHRALEYERGLLIERLTASNTELERFAYVASHDLQEPVRMVATFSQILAEEHGAQLDETGRQYLDVVRQSSMRMRGMIEDLLTYARAGNAVTETSPFDGQAALAAALDNLGELIKERSAEITADALPSLSGNPVQISRLWQNLLANAIKYQAQGAIPRIHVSITETPDVWRLSVRDNGIGIEERFIEQIFQPFRRLHVWDSIQGTGLGLSICRRIVENHGGKIWAESTPGQGTTFHFTLAKPSRT